MASQIIWESDAPLLRVKGETRRANAALRDYCLMGEGRSLRALLAQYQGRVTNEEQTSEFRGGAPPTRYWSTLAGWSSKFDWVARAARFDELEQERELREWRERRREDREVRIKVLESLRAKMIQGLKFAEPQSLSWFELINGVRMVVQELRHEYGESDQVVEVRAGETIAPSPAAMLSDDDLESAIQNLLVGSNDAGAGEVLVLPAQENED